MDKPAKIDMNIAWGLEAAIGALRSRAIVLREDMDQHVMADAYERLCNLLYAIMTNDLIEDDELASHTPDPLEPGMNYVYNFLRSPGDVNGRARQKWQIQAFSETAAQLEQWQGKKKVTQILLDPIASTGISKRPPDVPVVGKPATPTNVTATATGVDVTVSCSAVPGAGKYNFYRDGIYRKTQVSPQWVDGGLTAGTYTYQVAAVDESRPEGSQISDLSDDVVVTVSSTGGTTPSSKQVVGISSDNVTQTSLNVKIQFNEVCRLRTFVDTVTPPTSQLRFEDSLLYSNHNGAITGLTPETLYYIQVEAQFADGTKERSQIITQQTLASTGGLSTSGMQLLTLGAEKALGTVGTSDFDTWLSPLERDFSLNGGARIGVATIAARKGMQVELSPVGATASRPTNRVSIGYKLTPNRTYRLSQWVYIPSDFVGGGVHNGKPYGTVKIGWGLFSDVDVTGGVINSGGFSERFIIEVMPDNRLQLNIYDYSMDRADVWGDKIPFPTYLTRGAYNYMAMEITVNQSGLSNGVIRGWQDPNSTIPAVAVTGKQNMSSGDHRISRLKNATFMGGQGVEAYSPPSNQNLFFTDVRFGAGAYS